MGYIAILFLFNCKSRDYIISYCMEMQIFYNIRDESSVSPSDWQYQLFSYDTSADSEVLQL